MNKLISAIVNIPVDFWQMVITYFPGSTGNFLRRMFWRKRLRYLGQGVKIDIGVYFQNPHYISIGNNCWIDRNVIILAGYPTSNRITYAKKNEDFILDIGLVEIGENTHIGPNCILSGIAGISIGKNCGIAANCCIYSFSHHYRNLVDRNDNQQYIYSPMARLEHQSMIASPIVIQDYCGVGLCSIILPGVTLRKGTWIAGNVVIKKSYKAQTLVYNNESLETKDISSLVIRE